MEVGYVRLWTASGAEAAELKRFAMDYVKSSSTVVAGGLKSCSFFGAFAVKHGPYMMSKKRTDGIEGGVESNLEHVYLVVSLVERWLGNAPRTGCATSSRWMS